MPSCTVPQVIEFPYSGSTDVMNWHEIARALEHSIATLQEGIPDPLWWGSARTAYDASVADIIHELQSARWAILRSLEGQ